MAVFNISKPTVTQIKHGVERVAAVFVVTALTSLKLTNGSVSRSAINVAVTAGATAVYQLVISTLTSR